eukprot:CAMPEP_0114554276 /NCGR_PEP_ID=MMETSP0114-20121206/8125_1 /TAXON_ID=31324 /ORGANISM="Goniomonas sp, Strain m" /LENGTH=402 /DNA_ID=CAMNT_0001739315 /DNA_START=18 /DNA_END=1226 /DNA_ORIENTATION=+
MAAQQEWKLVQTCTPSEELEGEEFANYLSSVHFNETGEFLATGDHCGRIRVYKNSKGPGGSYDLYCEFQSHDPEFDYLKSVEIEPKINAIRWRQRLNSALFLVSTNDKTIKLWKAGCRTRPTGQPRTRRVFKNGHEYHIHSLSLNSDQEHFISADDLRINLWSLDVDHTVFNIVDTKPPNMAELQEVITAAACHPLHGHVFLWANSCGGIMLGDMRNSALCDRSAKVFKEEDDPTRHTVFTEIIGSVSDAKFSQDGRFILSRDYMTLKLWDINMEGQPLKTIQVHEPLRSRLCELYDNDSIFDRFQCSWNGRGTSFATGSYSHLLHVYDRGSGAHVTLDPSKKVKEKSKSRFGFGRKSKPGKGEEALPEADFDKKAMQMDWHPQSDMLAVAAGNELRLFHLS